MNIYEYTDYRKFLKDQFDSRKKENPNYSYRLFNAKAGVKSSSFLKLVIDGKRNLGDDGIQAVCRGFSLDDKPSAFFSNLVKFNQSKSHNQREYYFEKMLKQAPSEKSFLNPDAYELFQNWYYIAVLELLRIDTKDKKDVHWIARNINPSIGTRLVKRVLVTLKKLDLIDVTVEGGIVRKSSSLATPDEVKSLALCRYYQEINQLAAAKVVDQDSDKREFSSLTIAMSKKDFDLVKQETREFRKRIHSLIENSNQKPSTKKTILAHIGFQMFSLNK